MTASSELIARLEAATEGSRFLDVQIELFLQPFSRQFDDGTAMIWHAASGAAEKCSHLAPCYTASLDGALTLMPPDLILQLYWDGLTARVTLGPKQAPDYDDVKAPTPPLALCIAALKAREAA